MLARLTYVNVRARKGKRSARMLANARKDHSIALMRVKRAEIVPVGFFFKESEMQSSMTNRTEIMTVLSTTACDDERETRKQFFPQTSRVIQNQILRS